MTTEHADFYRLATGLRAAVMDFDYYRTRKLLDPKWDGYTMPPNHDLIHTDIDLEDANLLTSQHRDNPDMHRIVLDLDYGVVRQLGFGRRNHRLSLTRNPGRLATPTKYLVAALPPAQIRALPGRGVLNLDPSCDFALIPSTTPGHYHLILDVNLPWPKYGRLLRLFADAGIIERGYANASIQKGFSAIRPPWIRKTGTTALTLENTPGNEGSSGDRIDTTHPARPRHETRRRPNTSWYSEMLR